MSQICHEMSVHVSLGKQPYIFRFMSRTSSGADLRCIFLYDCNPHNTKQSNMTPKKKIPGVNRSAQSNQTHHAPFHGSASWH